MESNEGVGRGNQGAQLRESGPVKPAGRITVLAVGKRYREASKAVQLLSMITCYLRGNVLEAAIWYKAYESTI